MKSDIKEKTIGLFLPIYINKNKLLDINSILFDGYSEFSEEILERERTSKNDAKADVGFSIFKIGGGISAEESASDGDKKITSLKKVQTVNSLLSNTIEILKHYSKLKNEDLKVGDFVEIKGIFKNNSICDLLDQLNEVIVFGELITKLDKAKSAKEYKEPKDIIKNVKQAIKRKNDSERELVFESDDTIYVIHILTDNIYGSSIENIYNNELCFFGQIKEITNNYRFFADTQLSKFGEESTGTFTSAIEELIKTCDFKIDFELKKTSNNKKTIELDVIAIYRKDN